MVMCHIIGPNTVHTSVCYVRVLTMRADIGLMIITTDSTGVIFVAIFMPVAIPLTFRTPFDMYLVIHSAGQRSNKNSITVLSDDIPESITNSYDGLEHTLIDDDSPPITTHCFLSLRYSTKIFNNIPSMLN